MRARKISAGVVVAYEATFVDLGNITSGCVSSTFSVAVFKKCYIFATRLENADVAQLARARDL